jgi:hypothetical protein
VVWVALTTGEGLGLICLLLLLVLLGLILLLLLLYVLLVLVVDRGGGGRVTLHGPSVAISCRGNEERDVDVV